MSVAVMAEDVAGESRDGEGAGDHDTPYWVVRLTSEWHLPFRDIEYVKLMFLRSRVRDGILHGDTWPTKWPGELE